MRGKSGWHANLSHGTLAHLIFGNHPYRRTPEKRPVWPTATPPSSRSRRKCCSRPMPAASFRWRTARTTRRSIGSSRRCAASFRSIVFTCRRGSPAPCAPTASPSPSTATSTACSRAARSRSPDRPRTWINARIRVLYRKLYERRHCHSLEVYEGDDPRRRSLRRHARPRLLRREHVPPRPRRLQGRARASGGAAQGRRLQAARHPIRDRSPQDLRRDRGAAAAVSQAPGGGARRRRRLRRARHQAAGHRSAGACGACRRSLG